MSTPSASTGPIRLQVHGEGACFTRPEMKVERVSYEVMTPAAARGVLEAILWKREMRWRVKAIDVLRPIRFTQIRRNEVDRKASRNAHLIIEGARQQRAMLHLIDVAYVIHAEIELTDRAGPEDPLMKYREMFLRRAAKGQCYARPYLGTREFAAEFRPVGDDEQPPAVADTRDLGFVFYDFDYDRQPPAPQFFRAKLEAGRLAVPAMGSAELRR